MIIWVMVRDASAASAIGYTPADGRLAAAISTISASRRRIRDDVERSSEPIRSISVILRTAKRAGQELKLAMTALPVEGLAEIATATLRVGAMAEALSLRPCPLQSIILRAGGGLIAQQMPVITSSRPGRVPGIESANARKGH